MLKLRGGTAVDSENDEIFRELFLQKLPLTVRTALAIHKDTSLSDIAEIADNMVEVQGPQGQISEIQQRGNPEIAAVHTELQKIWWVLQSQQKPERDEQQRGSTPEVCWARKLQNAANLASFYSSRETPRPVDERSPLDWHFSSPPTF